MTDNSKCTGPAIEAHYQFLAWLVLTIEKFPKSHKFTIGDRIESIAPAAARAPLTAHAVVLSVTRSRRSRRSTAPSRPAAPYPDPPAGRLGGHRRGAEITPPEIAEVQ